MGKGIRIKSNRGQSNTSGNGGILGSGVFGLFGSTVSCKDSDKSYYCNFVKFFNLFIMLLVIVYIIFVAYTFLAPTMFSRRRK